MSNVKILFPPLEETIICRVVPIFIVKYRKHDGRWCGPGAEKQSLEFSAEETTEEMQRRMTFNILPGCEWYDDAEKLSNYLMIDAGEKPGRGSVADSSRVFSRMATFGS